MTDYQESVAHLLHPFPGENSAGKDSRYDKSYEWVRNKIKNLDTVSSEEVDWEEFRKTCEEILETKCKDILVACFLCYALLKLQNLKGITSGLWLVAELCDRYWDNFFPPPKKVRARVNSVNWLTEKSYQILIDFSLSEDDYQDVIVLNQVYGHFNTIVNQRFETQYPVMRPLKDCIARLMSTIPESFQRAQATSAEHGSSPDDGGRTAKAEKSEQFLRPISDSSPGGEDARYDDEYEVIRAEISKLESPSGGAVDWSKVLQASSYLLITKSKDFPVACYLVYAMYDQRGFFGLAEGLAILSGLIKNFWETGFPPKKRVRARANALSWLIHRFDLENLSESKVESSDRKGLLLLKPNTKLFAEVVEEKFGKKAPSLEKFLSSVEKLTSSVPESGPHEEQKRGTEEKEGEKEEQVEAVRDPEKELEALQKKFEEQKEEWESRKKELEAHQAELQSQIEKYESKSALQCATEALATLSDDASTLRNIERLKPLLETISGLLKGVGQELFQKDMAHPRAYTFLRMGLILESEGLPIPSDGHKTDLSPPTPDDILAQCDSALKDKDWEQLLKTSENALREAPYCFDFRRYSALALDELGYEDAYHTVVAETALQVVKNPVLLKMEFVNGQPFASLITRDWIETEVGSPFSGDQHSIGGDGFTAEESERINEARKLSTRGKLMESIKLLGELSDTTHRGLVAFQTKLIMVNVCMSGGQYAMADGILNTLVREIEMYQLERWDPDLAIRCYETYYKCLMELKGKTEAQGLDTILLLERMRDIYASLCRISPTLAIKIVE